MVSFYMDSHKQYNYLKRRMELFKKLKLITNFLSYLFYYTYRSNIYLLIFIMQNNLITVSFIKWVAFSTWMNK